MANDEAETPKVVTITGNKFVHEEFVPDSVKENMEEMKQLLLDPTVRGFAYVAVHMDGSLTNASSHHDKYGWALVGGLTRIIHRVNNSTDDLIGK